MTWITQGGPTELANLVLVCSRHHHVLHQPGWHAKLRPDGMFEVADPDGRVRSTSPRAEIPWPMIAGGEASSEGSERIV